MRCARPMADAQIVMPKLGLTMSEGLLSEWHVRPGDEVAAGQIMFVVETDKISNEVEAPAPGRILSLLVGEGETVDVGTPIATWTGPGHSPQLAADDAAAPPPEPASIELERPAGDRIRSTPFARRLAQQGGIPIGTVNGTGPRGRIQARDVRAALDEAPAAEPARPAAGRRDLRAIVAARVTRSKAEIPHFYVSADVAFDALSALRRTLNADPEALRKLSITAFLALAVARALAIVPDANLVWRDGRPVPLAGIAIGIAVDTPAGVMAPVISIGEADDLYAVSGLLEAAIDRARIGRLGAADVGEAAIGISNVGMFGVRALTPIIDPDQSFMLGVGAPQAVFRPGADGAPRAVEQVTLTLACDHRAIDGAGAARFLSAIVELLEHPGRLMVQRR
jgi:pyruvate dehydrogenase E2 component (dihydrolipoamide acetyltransferase)